MGRAMLIICAGVAIALAYMGFGSAQQGKQMTQRGAGYAKFVQAQNAAHTAIQIAMNEINNDASFVDNHTTRNTAWETTIDEAEVDLYVEQYYDSPEAEFWEPDSIRLVSIASYMGLEDVKVVGVYLKNPYQEYVEPFKSPLTIATNNYTFDVDGSAAKISGADQSGQCDEDQASSTPAVTLMSDNPTDSSAVDSELSGITTEGTQDVASDTSLSYEPTDDLIERLRNTDGVTYLTEHTNSSGVYKGSMGTADSPGVFFVDGPIQLSGGMDPGYGILVITDNGGMSMEDPDLTVAGNFEFNGLVVFENAYSLDGKGTPTINGSVLVGNTADNDTPIDIKINGSVTLQHDCMGEKYAKKAAASAIKQNKYTRIVTYE